MTKQELLIGKHPDNSHPYGKWLAANDLPDSYCCRYLVPAEWFAVESDAGKCRNGVLQCERSAQFVEFGTKIRNEL